jgi:nitrile hydratase beta subunit
MTSVNGVHDIGGMHGFGPVVREQNEPVFHADWEGRTAALMRSAMIGRVFNIDEFRRTLERMPPARYLAATYYERWLYALETLLLEKGVISSAELEAAVSGAHEAGGRGDGYGDTTGDSAQTSNADASAVLHRGDEGASPQPQPSGVALRYDRSYKPRFKVGDKAVARNINPEGHTRIPRYARGKHGVIRHDWGVFVFPDTHAHGQGANPQHCYSVEFEARELWGPDHSARERIYIDLWEDYLEADRAQRSATPRKKSAPVIKPAPTLKRMSAASAKKNLVRVPKRKSTTTAKKKR